LLQAKTRIEEVEVMIDFENVLKYISEDEIVKRTCELVAIPSYPGIENQETGVAAYICDFLNANGIPAQITEVTDGRSNVTAVLKGAGKGPSLLLTGHLDTVPPYDMPDAFHPRRNGNQLIGRGSVDMKGPLACMLEAMVAIKKSGMVLDGDLHFAGTVGEEGKSEGVRALLKKNMHLDGVIVGEPTMLQCVGVCQKGLEWFEVHIEGKAVHGGMQTEGVNAISKASKFIERIEEKLIPTISQRIHPLIGPSTMNFGTISGGTQPSTVAGECIIQMDRRWIPGEKYVDVVQEYQDIIDELHLEDESFQATLKVMDVSEMDGIHVHESMEIPLDHPLVETVCSVIEQVVGEEAHKLGFPAWTDAGLFYTYGGFPTVIFGPGTGGTAHCANEFIEISHLVPAAQIYALIAATFCMK
jgi:acetylornithine deacetylase/succinyl-diaminopimelate desuccinylase family protein